ncbi:hypothetical protein TNCV_960411 [Trichonephila clavipes]|nr:hypothetical protein TNCV_960411 [Trichonephila clavipes]
MLSTYLYSCSDSSNTQPTRLSGSKNVYEYCKEQLPAPGNRSNERRYREKDLATTEEKKIGTGEKREGDEKAGVVKSRHG